MPYDLRHVRFAGAERRPAASRLQAALAAGGVVAPDEYPRSQLIRRALERLGLNADAYRAQPLQRRLAACLRALQAPSEEAALAALEHKATLWDTAADALLVGVTSFFRDTPVFEAIRTNVLPALASRRRIRVWSAACSTGGELYSVAMLLGEARLLDRADLLGTDCRPAAVREAEEGYLDPSVAGEVDAALRAKYLEDTPAGPRVCASLRRRARWKVADLLGRLEDGPWDIILWRNSAMYLATAESDRLFAGLVSKLTAGGYLIVGKAERPPSGVPLATVARCIYRTRGA